MWLDKCSEQVDLHVNVRNEFEEGTEQVEALLIGATESWALAHLIHQHTESRIDQIFKTGVVPVTRSSQVSHQHQHGTEPAGILFSHDFYIGLKAITHQIHYSLLQSISRMTK